MLQEDGDWLAPLSTEDLAAILAKKAKALEVAIMREQEAIRREEDVRARRMARLQSELSKLSESAA